MSHTYPKTILSFAAVLIATVTTVTAQTDAEKLDNAIEDAAYKTVKQMYQAQNIDVKRIAFVGLFADPQSVGRSPSSLFPVFRAGLVSARGRYGVQVPETGGMKNLVGQNYEFFIRDEDEWDQLTGEIEFGKRRGDVMDSDTIQKFGNVKGVEAILDGQVREASITENGAVFRTAMYLTDVETGERLWAGNITGEYKTKEIIPLPEDVRKAAINGAKQVAKELSQWQNTAPGAYNIYILPPQGTKYAERLSDIIKAEIVSVGGSDITFLADASHPAHQRMAERIAGDIGASTESTADLNRIMTQLDHMFQADPTNTDGDTDDKPEKRTAALMGKITNVTEEDSLRGTATNVPMVFNMQTVSGGTPTQLWGANVTGTSRVPWWQEMMNRISERTALTIIGIAIGALFVLFILRKMFKAMVRPR